MNDKYDNNEYVIWIMAMMIEVLVKYTEFNVTNITVSPPLPQTATSDSPQPLCPLPSIFNTILLNTPLLLQHYSNEWGNHSKIHF